MNYVNSTGTNPEGGFNAAFEQMCNFVAVSKTGDVDATIEGLVRICFTILPDEPITSGSQLAEMINTLFGITVSSPDAEHAIERLTRANVIVSDSTGRYSLSPPARAELQERIDNATTLEVQVRDSWLEEITKSHAALAPDKAWAALRGYLLRAFRRHGIQSAALLDPAFPVDASHEASLASLLRQAVAEHFPEAERGDAERVVAGFLADLGLDANRSKYIAQLADAAFNFYALSVSPEISRSLRTRLRELTLFLDTNFLFGILDLHYNSQADVSHALLRVIQSHELPFRLRFHEATQDEMRRTIVYFSDILRSRQWSRSLSRAAAQSRQLTGIEQKFHERNAEATLDVDEFLRPIQHCDAVLAEQGIKIYRASANRLNERADLYHDYKEFLEQNGRPDKLYETIQHDATVLDATRLLRTKAKSSLDAGALLVTCDYLLYKFDRETSRRTGQLPCVVLPNMLWQLLRPFIDTDVDFERSFAETFALPEFRAIGSGGAKACSKMLSILATYKDVPEATALHLMTDGMLIGRLQDAASDEEFVKVVESAIVEENRGLLEETASLRQSLTERQEKERQLEAERLRREEEIAVASKEAAETIESQRGEIEALQLALQRDAQGRERRRALWAYCGLLALLVFASSATAWFATRLLPYWSEVIGRVPLAIVAFLPLFVGGHLLLELGVRKSEVIGKLWPFVVVKRLRTWLWSFVVISFIAGVIGNLVANRIQERMDDVETNTSEVQSEHRLAEE